MASAWLPRHDALLRAFAANLVQKVSANPAAYGLTPADVQPLASAAGLFAATLASASDPATRTRGAVAGKRAAKVALVATVRALVRRVTSDPAVSPRQIVDLGLLLPKARSPVPPPTTAPAVAVLDLARLGHTLRVTDGPATGKWAKPAGARAAAQEVGGRQHGIVFESGDQALDCADCQRRLQRQQGPPRAPSKLPLREPAP